MTRCNTYLFMAALAVSGLGLSLKAADNSAAMDGSSAAAQMQQAGGQMADEAQAKAVRAELASIVNASVESNNFVKVPGYLAKADKERLSNVKSENNDALSNAISQFRTDFKAKYNQDFDISGDHLRNAMVYAGQDKNAATVTIARPVASGAAMSSTSSINTTTGTDASTTGATADRKLNTMGNDQTVSNRSGLMSGSDTTSATNGNRTGPASNGQNSNSTVKGNDTTATPGVIADNTSTTTVGTDHTVANGATNGANTDVARSNMNTTGAGHMSSMANAGMSGTTLNLINEGHVMNAWRISAPQISAEQLKQNLAKHIQMLDDQKAAWPSDVNQAYQAAAYHVLSAFSDGAVATER